VSGINSYGGPAPCREFSCDVVASYADLVRAQVRTFGATAGREEAR
jgi:hypothetical protein